MTDDVLWATEQVGNRGAFLGNTRWYIFGSATKPTAAISDFDILVIYSITSEPIAIRDKLSELDLIRPIHLLFLTEDEENELQFIEKQACVRFH